METLRLADLDSRSDLSRLDDCLLMLHCDIHDAATCIDSNNDNTDFVEPTCEYTSWKDRFEVNRDQITRRLAMIEAELDRIETNNSPQLGVYGGHE